MRTLQEIADQCGFTKSLMSKIETGKTVPPVSTLVKIAGALGVKVSALLDEEDEESKTVYVPAKSILEDKMIRTNKGYSFYTVASERSNKNMQPFLFFAKKGEVKVHKLSHQGEEYIYMLEGCMNYKVGNTEYMLNPGDSLYFDSFQQHELHPLTEEVKYLAVFYERT
jgi:transcriptional regulator with XRE-family HTH domain